MKGIARWKTFGTGNLRQFISGVTWSTVGSIFNQGSTFLVNIVVAHVLGRSGFGEFSILQSTIAALALTAQLAMSYTATKFVAELRVVDRERASRILVLTSLLAGVSACIAASGFLVLSTWLASVVYRSPALAPALAIGAALLFLTVLNTFMLGALAGFEAFRATGTTGIATGSLYVLLSLVGLRTAGLEGLVAGMACSSAIQAVLLALCLRRVSRDQKIGWHAKNLWRERAAVIHFALPAAVAGLSQMSAMWLANTILARRLPDGFSQMAAFAAANSFGIAVLFVPNMINNVGMSHLNAAWGRGDAREVRHAFRATVSLDVSFAVAGSLCCGVAAASLMGLFGRDFRGEVSSLYVILLSTVPCATWYAVSQIISAGGRMWPVLWLGVVPRDLVLIVGASVLAPRWGAPGLAAAVALSWLVGLGVMMPRCARILRRPVTPCMAS